MRPPPTLRHVCHGSLRAVVPTALVAAGSMLLAHESTLHSLVLAQASPAQISSNLGPLAPLTLDLTLGDSGETVAGLVRITRVADGRPVDLPAHLRRPMGWYSLAAGVTVDVPAGEIRIEACHGLETEIATATTTIAGGSKKKNHVKLPLRQFYQAAAKKIIGANTHLHLRLNAAASMGGAALRTRTEAEAYLGNIGRSDGLDLVYVSTLHRPVDDAGYISNEFTHDDLRRLSDARLSFVNGEEHRHEGGRSARRSGSDELRYGHVLFLDQPKLVAPVSYGAIFTPGTAPTDAVPMRRAILEARAQGATVIWCHGKQGTEDVPNWIDGLLHAQNIFDGGSDGTYESVFYPYLNAGLHVPFSTGTDWGCYDFSRVYVRVDETPSSRVFLRNLSSGSSYITNGTFLEFEADGEMAGTTLRLPAARAVRVRARAIGRDDFTRLEIVFNGSVVAHADSRRIDGHFVAEFEAPLAVNEPGWLAVRIPADRPYNDRTRYTGAGANLFGKPLFAHTSPVYVSVGGKSVHQPAAVHALIAEIDSAIATIEAKGAFASEAERGALLSHYRSAKGRLQAGLVSAPRR